MTDVAPHEDLPPTLFKYRGAGPNDLKWVEDTICRHGIFLPAVSSFNDPFDSVPHLTAPQSRVARERLGAKIIRHSKNPPPYVTPATMASLLADMASLSTQADIQMHIRRSIDVLGMYCMTADPSNVLMWSHYGQSHAGVALGFRTDHGSPFQFALPIRYRRQRPSLKAGRRRVDEMVDVLTTKADFWAYEQEWRFFGTPTQVGRHVIPDDCLTHIVFGARTPATVVEKISQWNDARRAPAELQRATIDPFEFRLHVEPEGAVVPVKA